MRGSGSPTGVRKKQCQIEQAGEEQKREKRGWKRKGKVANSRKVKVVSQTWVW